MDPFIFDLDELVTAIRYRLQCTLGGKTTDQTSDIIRGIYESYPFTSDMIDLPDMCIGLDDAWLVIKFPKNEVELRLFNKEPQVYFTAPNNNLVICSGDCPIEPLAPTWVVTKYMFTRLYLGQKLPDQPWQEQYARYPFKGVLRFNSGEFDHPQTYYMLLPSEEVRYRGNQSLKPYNVMFPSVKHEPDFMQIAKLEAYRLAELLNDAETSGEAYETFVDWFNAPRYPLYKTTPEARFGNVTVQYPFDQRVLYRILAHPDKYFLSSIDFENPLPKSIEAEEIRTLDPKIVNTVRKINELRSELGLPKQRPVWASNDTIARLVDEE
ncbi:hypothetical protein [Vibrio phage VP4B]|uniref:Uncharacterized protein n=1 Tax=Vibrio phage VP4B TaxID=1262540 RepID=V9LZG2_9CAUD|nr:hypothetical protein FDJ61_gp148 [Vibrio phage VP4B]AGB07262.1 hypothetical protein [Vibrio phage VP4B]